MSVTFETGFNTTLAQSLKSDGSDTTITLSSVPIIVTTGVMRVGTGDNVEWIYFGGVSGSNITSCVRGLDKDAASTSDATASNKKAFAVGATSKLSLDISPVFATSQKTELEFPIGGASKPEIRTESEFRTNWLNLIILIKCLFSGEEPVFFPETLSNYLCYTHLWQLRDMETSNENRLSLKFCF